MADNKDEREARDHSWNEQLRELAREDARLEAPLHVEQAVLAAFSLRPAPVARRPRARLLLAAAAALVIGTTAALWWPVRTRPQTPAALPASNPGLGTDYFPLRAGPVLNPGEIGRVIRIPVPRAAAARYGLAETAVIGAGPLQADVLVGMDGSARAVRFVQ